MISLLLTGALVLLFISAALAPLEALRWWAGWDGHAQETDERTAAGAGASELPAAAADHFMIYLSGIGAMSGTSYPAEEILFLDSLAAALPRTVLLSDVFPYSVTNMGMTGERMFARLWRWIEQLRIGRPYALVILLLNLRNMFQVGTSVDPRYGPIYNLGIATELRRSLRRGGYVPGTPITLLGYSGGGQIAVGVAPYLERMCQAKVWVVSLGGVMASDPGIQHVQHLWHLYGSKDPIQASGKVLFAGRWPIMATSAWNRARAAGTISMIPMGPFKHLGAGSYFDAANRLPNGPTYLATSIDTIAGVLADADLITRSSPVVEEM